MTSFEHYSGGSRGYGTTSSGYPAAPSWGPSAAAGGAPSWPGSSPQSGWDNGAASTARIANPDGFFAAGRHEEDDPLLPYRDIINSDRTFGPGVSSPNRTKRKRHKDCAACCGTGCCCCCLYSLPAKIVAAVLTLGLFAGIGAAIGLNWPKIWDSWNSSVVKEAILRPPYTPPGPATSTLLYWTSAWTVYPSQTTAAPVVSTTARVYYFTKTNEAPDTESANMSLTPTNGGEPSNGAKATGSRSTSSYAIATGVDYVDGTPTIPLNGPPTGTRTYFATRMGIHEGTNTRTELNHGVKTPVTRPAATIDRTSVPTTGTRSVVETASKGKLPTTDAGEAREQRKLPAADARPTERPPDIEIEWFFNEKDLYGDD